MKWKKRPMNKRTKLRFQFWDLIDGDGALLAYVRWIPDREDLSTDGIYQPLHNDAADRFFLDGRMFYTLKDAKDHVIAYFVNKRLEEAHG